MLISIEDRDIELTLDYMANVLFYVNYTSVPCYFGAKETLLKEQWSDLLENPDTFLLQFAIDFSVNMVFNIGFIWTDIIMLSLATPSNTQSSYPFYMSFYVGDLIFRFWFKAEVDENCWYPWNLCQTAAEIDLANQALIDS